MNYDKHFETLHAKLDKLIALLSSNVLVTAAKPIEVKKEAVKIIAKPELKKAEKKIEKNVKKPAVAKAMADKEDKKAASKKKVSKKK